MRIRPKMRLGHAAETLARQRASLRRGIARKCNHRGELRKGARKACVTGKVYNHSKRMKEKRAVLDGVAAELRRIIGKPAVNALEQGLRLANRPKTHNAA